MIKRISSFLIVTFIITSIFITFFTVKVHAAENEHNLSGLVWQSNGDIPSQSTEYCIWVQHSGDWNRFPDIGWENAQKGLNDNLWWYGYVLPDEDYDIKWSDGDVYRVQVNGLPWDDFDTNATSNGTGSVGDPFPAPYDPQNPSNINNLINYLAGGGTGNAQQWDVRTRAAIDLAPINVMAYDENPEDFDDGIPVPPDTSVPINVSVTNYGSSESGYFNVSFWTCSATFVNSQVITIFYNINVSGDGTIDLPTVYWTSPSSPGDFYINITIDCNNSVAEYDETNNIFKVDEYGEDRPIHFVIGPELVLTGIEVDDIFPVGTITVPPIWPMRIEAMTSNVGNSSTGNPTKMAIYQIPAPGGSIIPGTEVEKNIPVLDAGETSALQTWIWTSPNDPGGDYYINISVDFRNETFEANEHNNNFTIHFHISDKPVTFIYSRWPRYPDDNGSWEYINTATQIFFTAGGANAPIYPYYRIRNLTSLEYPTVGWVDFTGQAYFTFESSWGEGPFLIEYNSTNSLGVTEDTKEWTVIMDMYPPETDITIGDPKYKEVGDVWNITPEVNFTLSADDLPLGVSIISKDYAVGINDTPGSGIFYRIQNLSTQSDVVALREYYPQEMFSLDESWGDGYYRIWFNSTDNLLQKEEPDWRDVYLDTTPPSTVLEGGQDNWNAEKGAWNVAFSQFFNLTADDGLGSGVNYTMYRIKRNDGTLTPWTTYIWPFNFTEANHGYGNLTIYFWSIDNLDNLEGVHQVDFYIEGDTTPPLPPVLKLKKSGVDIILEWTPSPDLDIHHYLIYRSETKTGFDFSTPWKNTLLDTDTDVIPLRLTWNDTNAVNSALEYYYTIRGVDELNNTGYTSNIVGKVTLTFYEGYNTFSLPLEPFSYISGPEMLADSAFKDEKDTIYYYNEDIQQWIGHPKLLPSTMNNFTIEFGEGYMLYILEANAKYTFVGSAGTAIRFTEGVGDDPEFRESLNIVVRGNDIDLSWGNASNITGYNIYRADVRMGNGSLTDYQNLKPIAERSADETTWTDTTATGNEYYYMVVAESHGMEGSGTYALGIKKYEIQKGYSLFSFVLQPKGDIVSLSTVGAFGTQALLDPSDTIYYYYRQAGFWLGHPKFLPENINTKNVVTGVAYMIFTDSESVEFAVIGI